MLIKPRFIDGFRCKASKCKNTCCAGWEIDVDEDTALYYDSLCGEDGDFVRGQLIKCEDGYRLCNEGERCRFLDGDNLCELIKRFGEDSLCDICREHPRFYSGNDEITEAGLGLCCEEAARLWLEEPVGFDVSDDGVPCTPATKAEFDEQMLAIEYLTREQGTLGERFATLMGDVDDGEYSELRALYASLEAMDEHYCERYSTTDPTAEDRAFANLAAYYVYRYWFELGGKMAIRFAAASLIMTAALGGELQDAASAYSAEVEYDPDNVEKICDFLEGFGLCTIAQKVLLCR